jgi:prepilin-type processing-associated H-X9-DG protein
MSQAPAAPASQPKTSGLAIAALVCGIAGLCTLGLGGIIGLVLSIIAMSKISKSAGHMAGRGLAIAGLIVSIVSIILIPFTVGVLMALLIPALTNARNAVYSAQSVNNISQLCKAAHLYTMDNNEQFPPPDTWPAVLKEKQGMTDQILADPANPKAGRAYAMNRRLAGVRASQVADPGRTVLIFECLPGAPPAGGPENLPPQPRRSFGYIIGFCDGHVATVPPEDLGSLLWDPKAEAPGR